MIYKLIKNVLKVLGYFIFIVCAVWAICNIDKVAMLIKSEYPTGGKYYLRFSNAEGFAKVATYYKREFYNEEMDFSNLKLYVNSDDEYEYRVDGKDDIFDDKKIRIMLLKNGLAELVNVNDATENEVMAQNYAIKIENGIWNTKSKGKITIHSVWYNILQYTNSNLGIIIIWFVVSVIGIGTIGGFVIAIWKKIISHMQVDIIPMGEVSSGKTTIIKRFVNPDITPGQLLADNSNTKISDRNAGEKIPCGKIFIKPVLYDNRGVDLGKMIDSLNKFGMKKSDKRVVIYAISFTEANNIYDIVEDDTYKIREMTKATTMLKILKDSSSIKRPLKVITFFNKCDLLYNSEQEFIDDVEHKKVRDKYSDEDLLSISLNSDFVLYGSAVMGWGICDLKKNIANL